MVRNWPWRAAYFWDGRPENRNLQAKKKTDPANAIKKPAQPRNISVGEIASSGNPTKKQKERRKEETRQAGERGCPISRSCVPKYTIIPRTYTPSLPQKNRNARKLEQKDGKKQYPNISRKRPDGKAKYAKNRRGRRGEEEDPYPNVVIRYR